MFKKILLKLFINLPLKNNLLLKILSKKKGILILAYHSIKNNMENNKYQYTTSIKSFIEQINIIKNFFIPISLSKAYNLIKNDKLKLKKPFIVLTFDDGFKSNLKNAYPILKKNNIPATIFISTNCVNSNSSTFMNWKEIKEISQDDRFTIGSHTISHNNLTCLNHNDLIYEIYESKKILEKNTLKKINFFSYPKGGYSDNIINIVKQHYLCALIDRNIKKNNNLYKLPRLSIDIKLNKLNYFLKKIILTKFINN